jgi:hypothetical protein
MLNVEDIICGDKFLELSQEHPNISYLKTDVFVRPSWWHDEWRNQPHTIKPNPIWISGHSDFAIDWIIYGLYSSQCEVWYSTNVATNQPNLVGIPLGITNDCSDSHLHPILGNKEQMIDILRFPKRNDHLLYMNINIATYPQERNRVYELFRSCPWVKVEPCEYSSDARRKYLQTIRNSTFVLCPRGNGVDTHRLWETLYMGSIPIVIRDIAFREFYDLPILFIDDWSEISEDFLRTEYDRITNSTHWNMEKLKFGYWKQRILHHK